MFVTTWRTIRLRVHPNDFLVYRYYDDTHYREVTGGDGSFRSRFTTSWRQHSLFSWADKGQWEATTTRSVNQELHREWNWFRIGFEPMFVDYTKSGTWLVPISLIEVSYQQLHCMTTRTFSLVPLACEAASISLLPKSAFYGRRFSLRKPFAVESQVPVVCTHGLALSASQLKQSSIIWDLESDDVSHISERLTLTQAPRLPLCFV